LGFHKLTGNIDETTKEIAIKDPGFFDQFENNTLKAAVVGNEIVAMKKFLQLLRGNYELSAWGFWYTGNES
jgi:hypothetical protein